MNKSATIIWWDDEVPESYLLCLESYELKLLHTAKTDNCFETEITVYGKAENIDRFIEDVDDDAIEPFEKISLEYDDCDEYYNVIQFKANVLTNCRNFESNACKEKSEW